jgi:hypothetical protein
MKKKPHGKSKKGVAEKNKKKTSKKLTMGYQYES